MINQNILKQTIKYLIRFEHFNSPLIKLLRLRATRKTLQLLLLSSLSSSPQQIWTDWRELLVEFSTFVKLDECGLIRTHWRNVIWHIFVQYEISCVKTWYTMWSRESNYGRSKRAYKWACKFIIVFHDVNSVL